MIKNLIANDKPFIFFSEWVYLGNRKLNEKQVDFQ